MTKLKRLMWYALIVFLAAVPAVSARPPSPGQSGGESGAQEAVLVGRISHVDGELLRFVPSEKDWVATVKDAPFGLEDALYSGEKTKAEFIMPNSTWVRVGSSSQVQMIALKSDITEMDVASGVGRFYNKSSDGVIKATTPFGYVMAPAGTIFDLYVGDESMEVIAIKGEVDYIHGDDESRYEVRSGSTSIIADSRQVTSGEGTVDVDWDDWNVERDELWSKRLQVKGDSVKYIPSQLHDDAHTLEENGRWERVEYEGGTRTFWRPTTVSTEWAPFTAGRWTEWYGDNCWVPAENFGYVTHHYGNWVSVNNAWYWAPPPPPVRVAVGVVPVAGIGFGWYPGRVGWVSSGVNVGWVPLAPTEVYYAHRAWGPGAVVVGAGLPLASININIGGYRYLNHAVVVNQNNFYNVNNYNNVRVTNINKTTIINNYRTSPVVNNTVINNYNTNRNRYNFTNATVNNKPHQTVVNRIQHNEKLAGQAKTVNAKSVQQNVAKAKPGAVLPAGKVPPPKATNKLVPPSEVNKPKNEVKFKQNDLKKDVKPPQAVSGPGRTGTGAVGKPGSPPSPRPGQGAQPGTQVRPGGPGKTVPPGKPGQVTAPGESKERPRPPRPDQGMRPGDDRTTGQPGQSGQKTRPPKPGQSVTPSEPERPGKPGTQRTPTDQTPKVKPGKPTDPTQPGDVRRPGQPGEGMQKPRPPRGGDRVQPGETRLPGQTTEQPGRNKPQRDRVQPGEQRLPGQIGDPSQRTRPPKGGERMQPQEQGMRGQPGGQKRQPQDQLPSREIQRQGPRQPMQESPAVRRPPGEQQQLRKEQGRQHVPPDEKKKKKDEPVY